MENNKKLELGIEIVAAMKASCYNCSIAEGRALAIEETEVDRMEGITPEYWKNLPQEDQKRYTKIAAYEKERLHKQAMFVAEITLEKLKQMNYERSEKF